MSASGTLYGVGVGPGDPELMSLKAARILKSAPVIAYFAKKGSIGNARRIVDGQLNPDAELVRLDYPFTTELPETDPCYRDALVAFYDASAATLAARLDAGQDVAVICAGDPFFYGSYAHLHERLADTHRCEVIPGITAMSGCWTSASMPMTCGDEMLAVLSGTMDADALSERLAASEAAVIMKVGRNLAKIRQALRPRRQARSRRLCRARHHAGGAHRQAHGQAGRPSRLFRSGTRAGGEEAAMTGRLAIVGLGPGAQELITPLASETLAAATDLVGYAPYLARVPERSGQSRHESDNREELARAKQALDLAASGKSVAVVSSGDPGVFAMASAVFEAIETGKPAWHDIEVTVVPGVSAMLAAAARIGAPLGHDFCVISLSDNLKPWDVVLKRLEAAASGDFIIVLYNPASKARPWQLGEALSLIARHRARSTPVIFAHAVSRPDERIDITTLADAEPAKADMRTLIIIGSSATKLVTGSKGKRFVYTPRHAELVES